MEISSSHTSLYFQEMRGSGLWKDQAEAYLPWRGRSWKGRRNSAFSNLYLQSWAWRLSGGMALTSYHYNNCFGSVILSLFICVPLCSIDQLYASLLWIPLQFHGSVQYPFLPTSHHRNGLCTSLHKHTTLPIPLPLTSCWLPSLKASLF